MISNDCLSTSHNHAETKQASLVDPAFDNACIPIAQSHLARFEGEAHGSLDATLGGRCRSRYARFLQLEVHLHCHNLDTLCNQNATHGPHEAHQHLPESKRTVHISCCHTACSHAMRRQDERMPRSAIQAALNRMSTRSTGADLSKGRKAVNAPASGGSLDQIGCRTQSRHDWTPQPAVISLDCLHQ